MTAFSNHHTPQAYWTAADRVQSTYERLWWLYGVARARQIIDGEDPATEADVKAWRGLGEGRARA